MVLKWRGYRWPDLALLLACGLQVTIGWWLLPQPFGLALSCVLLVAACVRALRP